MRLAGEPTGKKAKGVEPFFYQFPALPSLSIEK